VNAGVPEAIRARLLGALLSRPARIETPRHPAKSAKERIEESAMIKNLSL